MRTSSPVSTSVAEPPPTVAWSEQVSLPAPTGSTVASRSASATAIGMTVRILVVARFMSASLVGVQPAPQLFVHETRVGPAARALHDLSHQEAEQLWLPGPIFLDLRAEVGLHRVDLLADGPRVGHLRHALSLSRPARGPRLLYYRRHPRPGD